MDIDLGRKIETLTIFWILNIKNIFSRILTNSLSKCPHFVLENTTENDIHDSSKLLNGDSVYITSVIDVHNVYVHRAKDENDDYLDFILDVNSYCLT